MVLFSCETIHLSIKKPKLRIAASRASALAISLQSRAICRISLVLDRNPLVSTAMDAVERIGTSTAPFVGMPSHALLAIVIAPPVRYGVRHFEVVILHPLILCVHC